LVNRWRIKELESTVSELRHTIRHNMSRKTFNDRRYYQAMDDLAEVTTFRDLLQEDIDNLKKTFAREKEDLEDELVEARKAAASGATLRIACNKADDRIDDLETELDKAKDCKSRREEELRDAWKSLAEANVREDNLKQDVEQWRVQAVKNEGAYNILKLD
jgi:chromosome segregation ATPase